MSQAHSELTIRSVVTRISTDYGSYRDRKTVSHSAPTAAYIVEYFPRILKSLQSRAQLDHFKTKGSTGSGNITIAPWIATFDPQITSSATEGFYLVYLFSADLKRLYLSLAFGTTQFERYFGTAGQYARLESAASHLRDLVPITKGLIVTKLELVDTKYSGLHKAYQYANIVAKSYLTSDLPTNDELESDYLGMIRLYHDLVRNPLLPSIDDLIEAEITAPSTHSDTRVVNFQPRKLSPPKNGSGERKGQSRSYSQSSRKVGDEGERIVFEFEKRKVLQLGFSSSKVQWHARDGETPGWDITSLDDMGNPIYIEVKASVGKKIGEVFITSNEWKGAVRHGQNYYIYLVTDAMKPNPTIEILQDPAKLHLASKVRLEAAVFELTLGTEVPDREGGEPIEKSPASEY